MLRGRVRLEVLAPLPLEEEEHLQLGYDVLEDRLLDFAKSRFQDKAARLGEDLTGQLQKFVLIQVLDQQWRDHLNELILLRSGIGLRSFVQRNPLIEYKRESLELFEQLMADFRRKFVDGRRREFIIELN